MPNRREVIQALTGVAAGALFSSAKVEGAGQAANNAGAPPRREFRVSGETGESDRRARARSITRSPRSAGQERIWNAPGNCRPDSGPSSFNWMTASTSAGPGYQPLFVDARASGIQARVVQVQDEGLSKWCAARSDRFVAFTSPALQFPDLAAQQTEHAVKIGMRGVASGGHVAGEPLSMPKFDPFWAEVQELGVLVFMHPNNAENVAKTNAFAGAGDLGNIIGNPLETDLFLTHLIFDGTLDRFPGLKVCGAHAGGYLPSYFGRTDVACEVRRMRRA